MRIKTIQVISAVFAGFVSVFLVASAVFSFFRLESLEQNDVKTSKRQLPRLAFEFSEAEYAGLGAQALYLKVVPPRLHLPDMRASLVYNGQNGRPDALLNSPKMHFGIQGGKASLAVCEGEKVYLAYDKKLPASCKYTFSEDNEPTMIWFSASLDGSDAKITLSMEDENGNVISGSDTNGEFTLSLREGFRGAQAIWEIGSFRVDGTLLSRQKARWIGPDKFLENHGGEEFADYIGKHRIDFNEDDEAYSVFVKAGGCLVWENDRWVEAVPSLKTLDKPMLVSKKIDERIMTFELWDVEGKAKVTLSLVKSPENFLHEQLVQGFRFVGARTKTQVVFQIDDERLIVKPHDWLLLTKEGWKKLKTAKDIDDYVNRRLMGSLFIFEEILKNKEEKSILVGKIYNPNRTELQPIELTMMPGQGLGSSPNFQTPPIDKIHPDNNIQAATPLATH